MLKINLENHLNFDNKIYIAFSGGSDSSALLYLISDLRDRHELNLEAIHINHNISDDSKKWEDHCKSICEILNLPITIRSIQVETSGDGLESAARKQRYKEFENILNELIENKRKRSIMGGNNFDYIKSNLGATKNVISYLKERK